MRRRDASTHSATRSVATFIAVVVVGSFFTHELFSHFAAKKGSGPGVGVSERVVSDRATLKAGQVMRYDLVLRVDARVEFDVRASPLPVAVRLVPSQDKTPARAPAQAPESKSSDSRAVFVHGASLTLTKVEALPAGKWTLFIERSDEPAGKRSVDTTVRTEVSVL